MGCPLHNPLDASPCCVRPPPVLLLLDAAVKQLLLRAPEQQLPLVMAHGVVVVLQVCTQVPQSAEAQAPPCARQILQPLLCSLNLPVALLLFVQPLDVLLLVDVLLLLHVLLAVQQPNLLQLHMCWLGPLPLTLQAHFLRVRYH